MFFQGYVVGRLDLLNLCVFPSSVNKTNNTDAGKGMLNSDAISYRRWDFFFFYKTF